MKNSEFLGPTHPVYPQRHISRLQKAHVPRSWCCGTIPSAWHVAMLRGQVAWFHADHNAKSYSSTNDLIFSISGDEVSSMVVSFIERQGWESDSLRV